MNAFVHFNPSDIEQSIPQRFKEQVRRYSDKTAISHCGRSISYRTLDGWSNEIAHSILAMLGDAPQPVAILLDQGSAAVAAILGTLKSAKIYVALEPTDFVSNLQRIIEACEPALVISDSTYAALANQLAGDNSTCLNIDSVAVNPSCQDPGVRVSADSLAYIFYTSGSTGLAKGVFDCHRNVLHNVMRYTNNLRIAPEDRLSLIQSCSFSGTVSSLFSALLNGATLCPFDLQNKGISRMANWLNQERVTIFHSVPVLFDQLLSGGDRFENLRVVRLEGDQALQRHVRLFKEHFDEDSILAIGLGTTETGLIRQFIMSPNTQLSGTTVPIGYEVQDMTVRLTDENGDEVPVGAVGEITVKSPYVALGYWNREDLTAAAFSQDPKEPQIRTYRSGDLGRVSPEGCLEYVGRRDFQAKIRGRRIDVSEIENALREFGPFEQAVVIVREDRPGDQQLVAYLVTSRNSPPSVSTLRQYLSSSLPNTLLPARFVFLDRLPLDRNGKIDKRALPAPDRQRPQLQQAYVAATTFRQALIAECFGEILGLDEVGLHDNFFELGGDSLQATNLLLLLEQNLGIRCPPQFLYAEGTVAAIDRDIEQDIQPACIVTLRSGGTLPPLFCMHDAYGHVLGYRHLATLLGPDRPVYGVQASDLDTVTHGVPRLEEMADRYIREIRQVQPSGPYYLCGQCFGGLVAFETARQLSQQGERVALLALIDTRFLDSFPRQLVVRFTRAWRWLGESHLSAVETLEFLSGRLQGLLQWAGKSVAVRTRYGRGTVEPYMNALDTSRLIESRYKPRPYVGNMTLICPGTPYNQLGWKRVAVRGLDIFEIPVAVETFDAPILVQEPYVDELADTLRSLL